MNQMTPPPPKKRVRRAPEVTRQLILDAAAQIMIDEGYGAVTTRRIAKEIGINSTLIHYYFPRVDNLYIALHSQLMDQQTAALREATRAKDPLREVWRSQINLPLAALGAEILGLVNHRKSIAPQIAARFEEGRREQVRLLNELDVIRRPLPGLDNPVGLTQVLIGLARMVANEETIGLEFGHPDIHKFVDWLIAEVTATPSSGPPQKRGSATSSGE